MNSLKTTSLLSFLTDFLSNNKIKTINIENRLFNKTSIEQIITSSKNPNLLLSALKKLPTIGNSHLNDLYTIKKLIIDKTTNNHLVIAGLNHINNIMPILIDHGYKIIKNNGWSTESIMKTFRSTLFIKRTDTEAKKFLKRNNVPAQPYFNLERFLFGSKKKKFDRCTQLIQQAYMDAIV
jgi:hypothetical protein